MECWSCIFCSSSIVHNYLTTVPQETVVAKLRRTFCFSNIVKTVYFELILNIFDLRAARASSSKVELHILQLKHY